MRFLLAAAGGALLCGAAAAQDSDTSRWSPVTVPIRDAGTLNLATGAWTASRPDASTVVYDNTCRWTGGNVYAITKECEDAYDEGRIPSPSDPNAPSGANLDNWIDGIQIAYCTAFPTGSVDINVGFFDHNGGGCAGWLPQAQPLITAPTYNGATAFYDLSGMGLPGDNGGGGTLACWIVNIDLANNGFCLMSDGDGSFTGSEDQFNWSMRHEMPELLYGIGSGPLIAAEPLTGAFGDCTYNLPCPGGCGTGLGTEDMHWANMDGTAVGAPTCTACPNCAATNCYWFGGWPVNPWASFWLEMTSPGWCTGWPPTVYCSYLDPNTGTACGFDQCASSGGCKAMITTSNPADMPHQNADDYDILVSGAEINKSAVIFGGVNGQASIPFSSGTLCVKPPIKRTPPQATGGSAACTGTMSLRINDPASSNPILNAAPGTTVGYQGWLRDPMGVGTDVSDGVEVVFQ